MIPNVFGFVDLLLGGFGPEGNEQSAGNGKVVWYMHGYCDERGVQMVTPGNSVRLWADYWKLVFQPTLTIFDRKESSVLAIGNRASTCKCHYGKLST